MPLPIAHGLVGASVVALWHPQNSVKDDWQMLALGAALAISPDFDFFLTWGLHLGRGWHRGFTHSIVAALIVTGFSVAAFGTSRIRIALACGAAFLSHSLLDFLTTKQGGGVELLWPFSTERMKLGLIGISDFANGFHVVEMMKAGLIELALFAPMFLMILLFREYVFQNYTQREEQGW
jgi:membrane-bound metal-dependent hydrolase YbcI (DUF457 family)